MYLHELLFSNFSGMFKFLLSHLGMRTFNPILDVFFLRMMNTKFYELKWKCALKVLHEIDIPILESLSTDCQLAKETQQYSHIIITIHRASQFNYNVGYLKGKFSNNFHGNSKMKTSSS